MLTDEEVTDAFSDRPLAEVELLIVEETLTVGEAAPLDKFMLARPVLKAEATAGAALDGAGTTGSGIPQADEVPCVLVSDLVFLKSVNVWWQEDLLGSRSLRRHIHHQLQDHSNDLALPHHSP